MIQIRNLKFSYGQHQVLKGVSTDILKGALCGLFGPNGSGKTTLFKCCLNFIKAESGEISVAGLQVRTTPVQQLAQAIAFVPQDHKPPFPYKVKEIVLMGRTPHLGGGFFAISRVHQEKAIEAMALLGILDLADTPYDNLSGGQRQLVLIARAIAQETSILFLDEPTSALDFHNQIKIWKILRKLTRDGLTVVACSHDPNHILWFCDQVVMLDQGNILADGEPGVCFNEETLAKIYQDTCHIHNLEGASIVLPRGLIN